MHRVAIIAVVCLFGIAAISCSQAVSGIIRVRQEPVLNDADSVNFYKDLPKQIVMWRSGEMGEWVKSSLEDDQYQVSAGNVVSQITKYQDLHTGEAEGYRYDYLWEDGHLIEMKESSSKDSNESPLYKLYGRTVFHFENGRTKLVDVYLADALKDKYTFEYDSDGNIKSYENTSLSSFSHKWETSYRNIYTYDTHGRVTKIEGVFPSMEKESTTVSYGNGVVTARSSDREIKLTYDNSGRLLSEYGKYPSGEYRYNRLDLKYDRQGRLVEYISRYYDSEDAQGKGTPHDMRYQLSY